MSTSNRDDNRVKFFRSKRGWTQEELAERAGVSRTAVTAIEGRRLTPSVKAALALAKVLECTVEELFGTTDEVSAESAWAWPPPQSSWRYWHAEVGGRSLRFPVEGLGIGSDMPHDGASLQEVGGDDAVARQTLVLACCDPAAGLLANVYGRATGFRLIVIPRSSQQALALLEQGLVHVAGLHLSSERDEERNAQAVRSKLGSDYRLLRLASWQEGLAISNLSAAKSVRSAVQARLRWVGREAGSGTRACMDELLQNRVTVRRIAHDHLGVAEAIRSGWADAGVCLRLTCEQAGLRFLSLREEYFELCFSTQFENDARIQALIRVVRSAEYQRLISDLPGYSLSQTGEVRSVT